MKWSEEKVEQLKALAQTGISNGQIATQLGVKVTDVYSKRSQLGITIDKVKAVMAGTVNPEFEAPLPKNKSIKQKNEERFAQNRELDVKRKLIKLLKPAIILADESVKQLELMDHGNTVLIVYEKGRKAVDIEADSLLAIIADVTRKCLY